MKEIKTRYFTFEPYECLAVEEYLEIMAKQGWLLDTINRPFFRFKRIEPQNLRFYVDIPNVREDRLGDYIEYCKAAGWRYLDKLESNFIFYAEDNDKTIDIHTDQNEKFRVVSKMSLSNIVLKIILILMCAYWVYTCLFVMDDFLTSNLSIITFLAISVGGISSTIKVVNFFIWRVKAKRSLSKNEFMPYNNYKQLKRKNIFSNLGAFGLIFFNLLAIINENIHNTKALSIFFISLVIFAIFMGGIIYLFNSKKYYKYSNGILTLGYLVFFVYIMGATIYLGLFSTIEKFTGVEQVKMSIEDFGYKQEKDPFNVYDKSIIAEKLDYSYYGDENSFSYTTFKSDYFIVIKFHELMTIKREEKYGSDLELKKTKLPEDIRVYSDDEKKSYVVVSEDRVIDTRNRMDNINEDEFLDKIYEKLILE
ncbi:DUF2812 domain-containing protein [Clostridium intestinale]|uniref:DUF2812 domain-containing protein n=1 Tax=Clostridium intestinale URNW TaxID=1294142 RepID=U2PR26_9CLOT|nr:DUF2812 domain-containing protein [Clostridium intestinale]ERK28890.1 hypothetical protein CINTURNW_3803 [Clostridium intestinale URNW]